MRPGRSERSGRLQSPRDFKRVAAEGKRWASPFFVVLIAPARVVGMVELSSQQSGASVRRLGITASRKVGNAVVRNRVKRAIREWFREAWDDLPEGVDVVVIARRAAAELKPREIVGELRKLLASLKRMPCDAAVS